MKKEEYPIEEELEEIYKEIELLVKDDERSQQTIIKQSEEIERLNNIINELEKWAKEYSQDMEFRCYMNMMLEKIQELKGSDKE